jgi:hypothetical protein
MKIETKFDLDDNVWYMKNNKPKEVIITHIAMYCDNHIVKNKELEVIYKGKNLPNFCTSLPLHEDLKETELFKTKEDLIESLY